MKIFQVDAFTDRPFSGNPAAVCILPCPVGTRWMQDVAQEMNLSETAFLDPIPEGYNLRWFTPAVEVDLCGHATLASAHILFETGLIPAGETAVFLTRSGKLLATRSGRDIILDFPAETESPAPEESAAVAAAIDTIPLYTGKNRMDILVELESEDMVRGLRPNMDLVGRLDCRGLIVTAQASCSSFDFVSRFFGPAAGVPEDPVTGSAHCCLAPYWQARLAKNRLTGYQASRRGGVVRVEVRGDRVLIGGQAITVLTGELHTTPPGL